MLELQLLSVVLQRRLTNLKPSLPWISVEGMFWFLFPPFKDYDLKIDL